MGNQSCRVCYSTEAAWWHKAAKETNPPIVHPKVHPFSGETYDEVTVRLEAARRLARSDGEGKSK